MILIDLSAMLQWNQRIGKCPITDFFPGGSVWSVLMLIIVNQVCSLLGK